MLVERMIFNLLGLLRHWVLFVIPLVVSIPIAIAVFKYAPIKYEAKSTILLLSANRESAGFPRQSVIEQIAVLEAWLKSDQVLGDMLPSLLDSPGPMDAKAVDELLPVMRRSLALELIGAGVLEVRLEADHAVGLGRKLEIIVSRLLEGVLSPEAGILSAHQMIAIRRGNAAKEAEAALRRAVEAASIGSYDRVKEILRHVHELREKISRSSVASTEPVATTVGVSRIESSPRNAIGGVSDVAQSTRELEERRDQISPDRAIVRNLETLYELYEQADFLFRSGIERQGAETARYVRVFDAPERLTVVGRPRDPLAGKSSGWKRAVAVLMLAGLLSFGWVGARVLLDTRLRAGEDFESAVSLPVVARLPKAPRLL
jgi:hypothetical protein